jgi:hypothetical protein
MAGRSMMLIAALVLLPAGAASRVSARSSPYSKLVGTWVMDSTNGPDDNGLPKSETLVFAVVGSTLRITATADEGNGSSTSIFKCHSGSGAANDLGKGMSAVCTLRNTPDSVMYDLVVSDSGKAVSSEKGRLVVRPDGLLRDQYEAISGTSPATQHRHIYRKA